MIDMKKALQNIDDVIEKGPYKDTWASLSSWQTPKWYQKAKFGIFIHWGVYSVPAFDSEWYPRNMYIEGSKVYEHHIKTYGAHKDFDYKDFIPMFKAEKFDPSAWGGVAGYGTAMVLSYLVGQRKYPINYPLKSIGVYVAITALFYFLMNLANDNLPEWAALAVNTVLVVAFIGHIVYHDLPLKSLPVVGKYFK